MSISPVQPVSSTNPISTVTSDLLNAADGATSGSNPVLRSPTTTGYTSTAVTLSEDAGVIATLTGQTPGTGNSAIDLYNSLAQAGQSTANSSTTTGSTSTGNSTSTSTGTSTGTGASGSTAINSLASATLGNLVSGNPSLAPLAAQLNENQAIVNTFA
jgi:hypothetical protein